MDREIDIVIMWVDGASDYFRRIHSEAIAKLRRDGVVVSDQAGRHRDSGELFFLLRSICSNLPWFRRIYIVTNGQVPPYVNFENDRIELVAHKSIFKNIDDTPSFNTFAIETAANRIDGLSENYIRFSDDFFVLRPVTKDFFFGNDGNGVYFFKDDFFDNYEPYGDTLQYNAVQFWQKFGYMPHLNPIHGPQARKVTVMRDMIDTWIEWVTQTRSHRFRTQRDFVSLFLYPYFALNQAYGRTEIRSHMGKFDAILEGAPIYRQILAGERNLKWRHEMEHIIQVRPYFFNLNDHFDDSADEEGMRFVRQSLYELFPEPSLFEWPGAHPPAIEHMAL